MYTATYWRREDKAYEAEYQAFWQWVEEDDEAEAREGALEAAKEGDVSA